MLFYTQLSLLVSRALPLSSSFALCWQADVTVGMKLVCLTQPPDRILSVGEQMKRRVWVKLQALVPILNLSETA